MADLSASTLILVGHGSQRNPGSSRSTRRHADAVEALGVFGAVRPAFLKEEPYLAGALDGVTADTVFVVPNMASKGYLTETLIPESLGLTGPVTERITPDGHQRVFLCDPVGTHPALLDAAARAVAGVVDGEGLAREDTCVLVAGHGNRRNPENADQTRRVATRIRANGLVSSVRCAFLEESPFIKDWRRDTEAPTVIAMPFLISGGLHGAEDVPALMGIDPSAPELDDLGDETAYVGPFAVDGGRTVYYLRPAGADPVVEDIIVNRAKAALAAA